jgi:hypothetical protein
VYSIQATPLPAAADAAAAAAGDNAAGSSSSSDAAKRAACHGDTDRELSGIEVQQQLLLSALDVAAALAAAVQEEVVEVAESAEDEASTRVLIGPFVTKLVVSADFLTLLLVYLAVAAKHCHGQQQGLSQVTAAAAIVAAYGKRADWRQQQEQLQQLQQQQQQQHQQQQQQQDEEQQQQQQQQQDEAVAVPGWHEQLLAGLGSTDVCLPAQLDAESSSREAAGFNSVGWLLVAQAVDALLQIRCKLAQAGQLITQQWVVDAVLPDATAAAAVAENRVGKQQPAKSATAAPSSSSSAMHVRCPVIQQQLVLPLLLSLLELQALQPDDGIIYGVIPCMITALEIWLDVERKVAEQQQQQQREQPWGTCETAMAAMVESGLLPQLLHVLGPAVLCIDRGLDENADRMLAVHATRVCGRLVFSATKAGECFSSSSSRGSSSR